MVSDPDGVVDEEAETVTDRVGVTETAGVGVADDETVTVAEGEEENEEDTDAAGVALGDGSLTKMVTTACRALVVYGAEAR